MWHENRIRMGDMYKSYNDNCQLYNHDYHNYRHMFLRVVDL